MAFTFRLRLVAAESPTAITGLGADAAEFALCRLDHHQMRFHHRLSELRPLPTQGCPV